LYTWEAARKACPKGWRLSNLEEIDKLIKVYGGNKSAYKELIKGGKRGFAALLGGIRDSDGEFIILGKNGNYWSATAKDVGNAWIYNFDSDDGEVSRYGSGKLWAYSCRCLQD